MCNVIQLRLLIVSNCQTLSLSIALSWGIHHYYGGTEYSILYRWCTILSTIVRKRSRILDAGVMNCIIQNSYAIPVKWVWYVFECMFRQLSVERRSVESCKNVIKDSTYPTWLLGIYMLQAMAKSTQDLNVHVWTRFFGVFWTVSPVLETSDELSRYACLIPFKSHTRLNPCNTHIVSRNLIAIAKLTPWT